jgi:predicted transcriptional regulator
MSSERESAHPQLAPMAELNSATSKLTYLYLHSHGEATVDELERNLDVRVFTLLGILRILRQRDLVTQDGECWTCAR